MWTLIKRELEGIFLIWLTILSLVTFLMLISAIVTSGPAEHEPIERFVWIWQIVLAIAGSFYAAFVGGGQAQQDMLRRVSSFMTTLATTRGRIFAARVIAGIGSVLALLGVLEIILMLILQQRPPVVPLPFSNLALFAIAALLGLAAYGGGLMTGWSTSHFAPVALRVGFWLVLLAILLIKGYTGEAAAIFAVTAAAALYRAWFKYRTSPLH